MTRVPVSRRERRRRGPCLARSVGTIGRAATSPGPLSLSPGHDGPDVDGRHPDPSVSSGAVRRRAVSGPDPPEHINGTTCRPRTPTQIREDSVLRFWFNSISDKATVSSSRCGATRVWRVALETMGMGGRQAGGFVDPEIAAPSRWRSTPTPRHSDWDNSTASPSWTTRSGANRRSRPDVRRESPRSAGRSAGSSGCLARSVEFTELDVKLGMRPARSGVVRLGRTGRARPRADRNRAVPRQWCDRSLRPVKEAFKGLVSLGFCWTERFDRYDDE